MVVGDQNAERRAQPDGAATGTKAGLRYTPTMYVDSGAGAILVQMLFWVVVVALLIWLFGRAARRR
jgi:hypothetical protein